MIKKIPFYIDKKLIYVYVEPKRNKHMYLRVKSNHIYCSIPYGTPERIYSQFIKKHIHAFTEYLQKMEKNEKISIIYDFLYFNGKKYDFKRLAGFHKSSVEIYNENLYVKTIDSSNEEVMKAIIKFLENKLQKYLNVSINNWVKKMSLSPHVFKIIKRKTVWGLNMVNQQIIKFSYKLAHYTNEVIDYVVVHELVHSIQPNHSYEFWNIVKKYYPKYKDVKLILKNDISLDNI